MAELSTLARPYAKAAFDYANEHGVVSEWQVFLSIASSIVGDEAFIKLLDNPAVLAEQKAVALVDIYDVAVVAASDADDQDHSAVLGNSVDEALDKVKHYLKAHLPTSLGGYPKATPALKNFVTQLAEHERLALLPEIHAHYQRLKSQALKQVDAYVTSAYPLTAQQREAIQQRLAASMDATVVVHESVDPSLVAGATIKVGDKLIDDSVRGKLKQLKTQLTV